MKIKKTKFKGTFILNHNKINDKRCFFMRGFCNLELKNKGINFVKRFVMIIIYRIKHMYFTH